MRACEGCRKRKIKCDAATTNSWPCAACIRLKLNCVPPTMSYDQDYKPELPTFNIDRSQNYQPAPASSPEDYHRQMSMSSQLSADMSQALPHSVPVTYADNVRMYQAPQYLDSQHQEPLPYASIQAPPVVPHAMSQAMSQSMYATPITGTAQNLGSPESDGSWQSRTENVSNLADALGELKIEQSGVRM
jgi:hypothetical protein